MQYRVISNTKQSPRSEIIPSKYGQFIDKAQCNAAEPYNWAYPKTFEHRVLGQAALEYAMLTKAYMPVTVDPLIDEFKLNFPTHEAVPTRIMTIAERTMLGFAVHHLARQNPDQLGASPDLYTAGFARHVATARWYDGWRIPRVAP